MSETTRQDLDVLREGLRLVEREYQGACLLPAEDDPTWEARAWSAVAALVRRELEALEAGGDVRGRIIRASILPIEDEETMIAGLRAGAEAVERGELDADDFVGIWSQYLRQLLRASSVPAPADMRERVAREVYLWEATRFGADESWALRSWREESNTRRRLYFNVADRILALFRTPRGEGEVWCAFLDALGDFENAANLWVDPEGPSAEDMAQLDRARQRVIECASALATIRPEAQGEDRWEDLVFGQITEAYNEAHAALRSEAQAEAGPEDIARRIARDCRLLFDQTPEEDAELRRALADLAEGIEARLEWVSGPARRGEGGGDARRS